MQNNFFDQTNNNINFIESHIGGDQNDTLENFNNQKKLIDNSQNEYLRSINYFNKLDREKNDNEEYDKLLYLEKHSTTSRINNAPTFVDDINYSNPIIYPERYDPYFEYLASKNIGSLDTRVIKKKTIVNVDSSNRNKITTNNIKNYITLGNNSLAFTNNSNTFRIYTNDALSQFTINDKIVIRGFQNYTINYKSLNFFFTNEKNYVILDLNPNFDFIIPYYDILVSISNVTNNGTDSFNNIPLNIINQTHIVTLFEYNNDIRLKFEMPITFYTDNDLNKTLSSECTLTFNNLGNFPISLINANYPLDQYNLTGYQIIKDVSNDYIEIGINNNISITPSIHLQGYWDNNIFYTGGNNMQIGKISSITTGYLTPNKYSVSLNKSINNVASIRIISSEIPNIKKNINSIDQININNNNNKFYWDNLLDNTTYSITLDTGFYTPNELATTMETLISKVPRNNIILFTSNLVVQRSYLDSFFNNMQISFDTSSNTASFSSYNIYSLPQCLYSLNQIIVSPDSRSNKFIITITHNNHNLRLGDRIFISNSEDYFYILASDINREEGYEIIEVKNNSYYSIELNNINVLPETVDTNSGGYKIKIKTSNSFRLRFDFPNTFGNLIGFNYTGTSIAITPYSKLENNYIITNKQPYVYDITKILVYNNSINLSNTFTDFNLRGFRYLLLQCENLNNCTNPNSVSYFYKFQLNDNYNAILLNTFVNTPVYFNPPIRSLTQLNFNFVDPNGNDYNFYNIDNSFTLEITSFDNSPENTFINTSTARI
jgi:hypothetical protein